MKETLHLVAKGKVCLETYTKAAEKARRRLRIGVVHPLLPFISVPQFNVSGNWDVFCVSYLLPLFSV